MSTAASPSPAPGFSAGRDPKYLRMLLALLLTASFFDGYDGGILDVIKPQIQDTFRLTETQLGWVGALIHLGAVAAVVVALSADWVGRRPILLWSVVGYAFFTGMTALSPNVWMFVLAQFAAQIFLGSEYAVAVTMITEEFPPADRGRKLGIFSFMAAAGVILVPLLAATLPGLMLESPIEWRAFYVIGIVPLLATAVWRRRVKETALFEARQEQAKVDGFKEKVPFYSPWLRPYRFSTTVLAFVVFCRSFPIFAATGWWVWYAQREAGVPAQLVFLFLIGAYGLGIFGYYVCGRMIDSIGRRPVTITFGLLAWVFCVLLFTTRAAWQQAAFVAAAVFFGLGVAPAINAFLTELFPTKVRAMAAAWARNVFEIPGIVLGPLLAGYLGDHGSGALGSVGSAVVIMASMIFTSVWLVYRYLPETRGRDLLALDHGGSGLPQVQVSRAKVFGIIGAMAAGVLAVSALIVFAIPTANRPEGPSERFLREVGRGVSKQSIEDVGTLQAAESIVGGPISFTRKSQDLITREEVAPGKVTGATATVPAQWSVKDSPDRKQATLQLERNRSGSWIVVGSTAGADGVVFPSAGGTSFGEGWQTTVFWAVIVLIGSLALATGVVEYVKRHSDVPDPAPLLAEPVAAGGDETTSASDDDAASQAP